MDTAIIAPAIFIEQTTAMINIESQNVFITRPDSRIRHDRILLVDTFDKREECCFARHVAEAPRPRDDMPIVQTQSRWFDSLDAGPLPLSE